MINNYVIKIFSSKENKKLPMELKNVVKMYVCGPTVYDKIHIGNARTFVFFDVVYRYLKYMCEDVIYVRNITDIDDKIEQKSIETNIPVNEIVETNINFLHDDLNALNCLEPSYEPRATENMYHIIGIIKKLINGGYAYEVEGNVYFDISKYNKYDKIFNIGTLDLVGEKNIDASLKRDPRDFVLWKNATIEHEKRTYKNGYQSPWGYGRPGWHIECSAMSTRYLGDTIDIHGGGQDLIFPHHVNEVAQSDCYFSGKFKVEHWMHNGFITINGQKMSKSLNNVVTVADLRKQYSGDAIRFFLLNNNYRNSIDFSHKLLEECENYINSMFIFCYEEINVCNVPDEILYLIEDDFNLSKLFSKLNEDIKLKRIKRKNVLAVFKLLGFEFVKYINGIPAEVDDLVEERNHHRANKNWKKSDELRDLLFVRGYLLIDREEDTIVRKR